MTYIFSSEMEASIQNMLQCTTFAMLDFSAIKVPKAIIDSLMHRSEITNYGR